MKYFIGILFFSIQMGFAWEISPQSLEKHVRFLADPKLEGRLTGTQGAEIARDYIKNHFKALDLKPFGTQGFDQPLKKFDKLFPLRVWYQGTTDLLKGSVNVLAQLGPNGERDHCVLIGAHYDGRGVEGGKVLPGADDNASGVASLIEMARVLKPHENKLKRCVIFAAWDFEEYQIVKGGGVKGSRFYVEHPVWPLERTDLTVTFDLIGGHLFDGVQNEFYVFGSESYPKLRHSLLKLQTRELKMHPVSLELLEPTGPGMPRSDYGPFRDHGIPSLFFTTGTPWYYHKHTDTPDHLNYGKQAVITELVLELLEPYLFKRKEVGSHQSSETALSIKNGDFEFGLQNKVSRDDIRVLKSTVRNLVSNAKRNHLNKEQTETLKEDYKVLEKFENDMNLLAIDPDVCHLQKTFIDVVQFVGGLDTFRAEMGRFILGCDPVLK